MRHRGTALALDLGSLLCRRKGEVEGLGNNAMRPVPQL